MIMVMVMMMMMMIIAFRLQQWLHEHASVVRYTCIPCLVWHLIWI